MNFFYILLILGFIGCCLYSAYSYYNKYTANMKQKQYIENKEFLKKANSIKTEFYFFHTKWCPHCKNAMPIWDNIKNSTKFGKYKVNFISIDCEDKNNDDVVKSFKVKEYPSYVLTAKGKNYVYDANLHPESLERFFKAVYKNL